MGKFNITTPNYRIAENHLFEQVFEVMRSSDGLLSILPSKSTVHSGPIRNVRDPVILDQPLQEVKHIVEIPFDVVKTSDFESFTILLFEFANAFKKSISQSMFRTIETVTDAVGNTMNAKGQGPSHDLIIDMIEKMGVSFDENGQHQLSFVMHPETYNRLVNIPQTPEQIKRLEEVIDHKRKEYYASKPTRKLY